MCHPSQIDAPASSELDQDVVDVRLDRGDAQLKVLRDLLVRQARPDERDDLPLASRKALLFRWSPTTPGQMAQYLRGHLLRNGRLAARHTVNGGDQLG